MLLCEQRKFRRSSRKSQESWRLGVAWLGIRVAGKLTPPRGKWKSHSQVTPSGNHFYLHVSLSTCLTWSKLDRNRGLVPVIMAAVSRPRVFMDISIGETPAGRIVYELFSDQVPRTTEKYAPALCNPSLSLSNHFPSFRVLCNGENPTLSYRLSPFHRIIDEFMIQGGDITKGDGTGGVSIYGAEFEDENLSWRDLDAAGLVCMANRGKGTNSSQFVPDPLQSPHQFTQSYLNTLTNTCSAKQILHHPGTLPPPEWQTHNLRSRSFRSRRPGQNSQSPGRQRRQTARASSRRPLRRTRP